MATRFSEPVSMNVDLLRSHSLLRAIPGEALADLGRKCRTVNLEKGEVLLSPGQQNQHLYFLLSGRLQVHLDARDSENGFLIQPGEVIGEMSIIEGRPVGAWVLADEASMLLAMPAEVFWGDFVAFPEARKSLLQALIARVRKTDSVLLQELERKARYQHLQRELESAGKIQASILPNLRPLFPNHPAVETHAVVKPAREVGGDFFDACAINHHTIYVAVGDVSGKGMPAALFMVRVLTLLRVCLLREANPARILGAVNRLLCEGNEECMFVSLAVGLLDTMTGRLTYLNGGHNPPVVSTAGGPFRVWVPPTGMLLGVNPKAEFEPKEMKLSPGDTLVMYTDGISEAENAAQTAFGLDRVTAALSEPDADLELPELTDHLERALAQHTGGLPPMDDMTLLALRYRGDRSEAAGI